MTSPWTLKKGPRCWPPARALLLLGAAGLGCDFAAIKECHSEMEASQKAMLEMDSEDIEQVTAALGAVVRTHEACVRAERTDEVSKVSDAKRKLEAQIAALKARAERKKRPKLTEAELSALEKAGDPSCPKGSQYEHHQNKKLIRCTGKQVVDMNWAEAQEYYERRGFTARPKAGLLRLEKGSEVYDFEFSREGDTDAASCLSVVAQLGIPWEEAVARLTGVAPQKLSLDKPVPVRSGPRALLVEGDLQQFSIKIGKCAPTPGQKLYVPPENPPD